jgi:DNA-3-methyladenine glycosylase I
MEIKLNAHADGLHRCSWCGQGEAFADYVHYHDNEWGMAELSGGMPSDAAAQRPSQRPYEHRLFEKITLEGFQSGLSWLTILRKRERFRQVFAQFDFEQVARFGEADVARLLGDAGIVRHRGKVASAINNAQRVCSLLDKSGPGALARLVWAHEPSAAQRPAHLTPEVAATLAQTDQSLALSKTLKKLGFSFVGPTTMYALMQSMGVVNDHLEGCHSRAQAEAARSAFVRPG